jgi:predicted ribosomally synthesized peptide with SipW-like signal peptide
MPRIILSISLITIVIGALAFGGTTAFFSDTESSVANVFTAGAIDLTVDNDSYYNGVQNATTTWQAKDLTIEKFFDFGDLKPDDYGEDTISLHVANNDSYICANVKLTSNDDNTQTEPEALVDANGLTTGELAGLVNFLWWADDGDNVFESDEQVISQGPIGALGVGGSTTIALADSATNIWTGSGGPIPGNQTHFIGKAWCFGTIGTAPIVQDDSGSLMSPSGNNNGNGVAGEPEDGGITCDGTALGNESQTDSLTADVTFSAVQARHNNQFLCVPPVVTEMGKLNVVKIVVNNNGGNNVDDGNVSTQVFSGATSTLPVGTYNVSEVGADGYQASFTGACDAEGNVTIGAGEEKICYITNTELSAHITLKKVVTGTPPLALNTTFGLKVDGIITPTGASVAVTSNAPHTINEVGKAGYAFVSITGDAKCPAVLGGTVTLDEGENVTCTITNIKN